MIDPVSIALYSIVVAGATVGFGAPFVGYAEGKVAEKAMMAMAQQPDEINNISRNLFISLAMVESSAIYCLVVSMILLFANPFWSAAVAAIGQ